MSYRSPPPPTNSSSYGDNELTDDGWSQHSGPPKFTNYPQGNLGGQPMQPGFNQGIGGRYSPGNIQNLGQNQAQSAPLPDMATLSNSMTQDDILFMRKFRKECFLYRVLPFAAVGWGTMFTYNRAKQLPNKITRYVIIGFASLFAGVATYRGEFRRMINESKLNTPYMQALRRSTGLPPLVGGDDFAGDYSVEYGSKHGDGSTNWGATELSSDQRFGDRSGFRTPGQLYTDSSFQPPELNDPETPKSTTTYEELRAKNRGYIR